MKSFKIEIEIKPVHAVYCYNPKSKAFIPKHCNQMYDFTYKGWCKAYNIEPPRYERCVRCLHDEKMAGES